ncbi:SDR family NAD(P)-dependent oxidoreductase [Paracoccus sp. 1_MG-2023]|uniref:SDR family NAD(P)-dependent oxidoreductase n=1 Tax=unclassified Paracoccus (in: a-proteobacteria) TaxID=2688777 RepID=UPI001C08CF80|nr:MULTISPECIES: SDR family NAD(P)-dependent oxidoreductase [unclassified Paracoccus (in: a-proteobacteria)]MBU2958722.1 SDR family NAD(P)-dependent oxidoreductase [Paracoccus sp. C2R09]MDO6667715.1 SDR family NAD(P)-dependent oxidoreductase [Paracoccus sp. 1_MG-2023]
MEIEGRVFVVTGAASGLGAASAAMLAGMGASVVIADLAEPADQTAGTVFAKCDVTQEDDAQSAIAMAKDRFGRLDGLVNCAGIAPGERMLGRDGPHALDSFARAVTINLIGSFNMARLAAQAMAANDPVAGERGVIVNTASIAAMDGQIGQVAYAAGKAGVAGMTLPMARDLARHGIRVMTIAPGIFRTPMLEGLPQDVQDSLGAAVPFPSRLGEPSEYAALLRHIVENPMLNGEVIRLDGALRMAPK